MFLFFLTDIRLPSQSQGGLEVRRIKGGCDLLAPSVRSTTYDFRRQDSGRRPRDRLEWLETEMDFLGDILCILCIRNNINGRDEAPACSSRNHSFPTLLVHLFSRESDLMVGIIEYKNTSRILSENRNF